MRHDHALLSTSATRGRPMTEIRPPRGLTRVVAWPSDIDTGHGLHIEYRPPPPVARIFLVPPALTSVFIVHRIAAHPRASLAPIPRGFAALIPPSSLGL